MIAKPGVQEKVLLHLLDYADFKEKVEVPFALSQMGIANAVAIARSNVPRAISGLRDQGLLVERQAHVQGVSRKRKAYFLTDSGIIAAEETWNRLLTHASLRCAPFFRLHDRLRMHQENENYDGDIWFDVDMENLTLGNANLFAYVLNQSLETQQLILRVQTPDFRPNECVYGLKVPPYEKEILMNNNISIAKSLPTTLLSTKIIWQSLIPSSTGEATVTVRLEDTSGNLVSGRVLTVQVRSDIFTRLRLTTGALLMIGAIIAVVSPLIPFALSLLGL